MHGALDQPTLVLNKHWTPVHVTSVRHAITLVFSGRAHVVCPVSFAPHDFPGWIERGVQDGQILRGVHFRIESPEIIVLGQYAKVPPRGIAFNRRNLIRRDESVCQYCGRQIASERQTIDHVMPLSRGGATGWENCVLACHRCNGRKANRTPSEASMQLLKQPGRPNWNPRFAIYARDNRPASWSNFIQHRTKELAPAL